MREPRKAKIDRCSIERANGQAMAHITWASTLVAGYREDLLRQKRLEESECCYCYIPYGGGRQGCAIGTTALCGICSREMLFRSDCVDVLCPECARQNHLCKHCGADVDLKNRRKPRPYEEPPKE